MTARATSSELRVMPSGASRFCPSPPTQASVLINMPILKDHGIAGLSGALKNNFGLVHNPNKFHLNGCDPHVAEVNAVAVVRRQAAAGDLRRAAGAGGGRPGLSRRGGRDLRRVLLATDPVALDVVAWELLEKLRNGPQAAHL